MQKDTPRKCWMTTMSSKTTCRRSAKTSEKNETGKESSGAPLYMLATVASQTLHSEKSCAGQQQLDGGATKSKEATDKEIEQLLKLSATELVRQFSEFTSDELKKQYSYTCALVEGCSQKYSSFASEGRARMSIQAHLAQHLEFLKANKDAYDSFKVKDMKSRKPRATGTPARRGKVQQLKKPQEALNKENKNFVQEKPTTYIRRVLSNEINLQEENFKIEEIDNRVVKKEFIALIDEDNFKVSGDHSYSEKTVKLQQIPVVEQVANEVIVESVDEAQFEETVITEDHSERIMLMVVENDNVHMTELPFVAHNITDGLVEEEATAIEEIDTKNWIDDSLTVGNMEVTTSTKPKGKAKFIGTSKEEKEMAMQLIEQMQKNRYPPDHLLQCTICKPPRSFTAPTTLVSHYRSHAGIKPYECRICRAVFTRRHSLKYHLLIHQNQTRFTCEDCGKKFRHPSHFREHKRRHTGEAPFGCGDCGQRFKTRNTYKRHLKTRHGKVLMASGELQSLPEEEFEKIKPTRRRRVNNIVAQPQHPKIVSEDMRALESIIEYQKSADMEEEEEEAVVEEVSGNNEIWTEGIVEFLQEGDYEKLEIANGRVLVQKTVDNETEELIDGDEINQVAELDNEDSTPETDEATSMTHAERIFYEDMGEQVFYDDIREIDNYVKVEYCDNLGNAEEMMDCTEEEAFSNEQVANVEELEEPEESEELSEQQMLESELANDEQVTSDQQQMFVEEDEAIQYIEEDNSQHDSDKQYLLRVMSDGQMITGGASASDGEIVIPDFSIDPELPESEVQTEDIEQEASIPDVRSRQTTANVAVENIAECQRIQTLKSTQGIQLASRQSELECKTPVNLKDARLVNVVQNGKQNTILILPKGMLKDGVFQIDRNGVIEKITKAMPRIKLLPK